MRTAFLILLLMRSLSALGCGSEVATFDTGSGPYFPEPWMLQGKSYDLTNGGKAEGRLLVVKGRVTTGEGSPRANAIVILWQADRNGFYLQHILRMAPVQPHFGYIGVLRTNDNGEFLFYTLRPPPYGPRCAHIHLATSKTDDTPLFTEVHFADDTAPERALDLSSPAAQDLIKSGTPTKVQFAGAEPRDAELIEFNIVVD